MLSLFFTSIQAQPELINQLDKGKKNGKWIVYLSADWKEVKDSTTAAYFKYTVFDHGKNIYPASLRDKAWKLSHIEKNKLMKGNAKLLDGNYTWVDKDNHVRAIDEFKNGDCILYKSFFKAGELNQIFNYTKRWKDEPNTYIVQEFNKQGMVINNYIMRNGPQGWALYPIAKAL